MQLEIRTAFLFYIFIVLSGAFVLAILWQTHKRKYTGLSHFFWGFTFQAIALLLMLLRNEIPDLFSIISANLFSIWGACLLYQGFSKFLAKKTNNTNCHLIVIIYGVTLLYSTYVLPNVNHRIIYFSIAFIAVLILVLRLLNNESSKLNINLTQEIKYLFWIYISINIIRIGVTLLLENNPKNYFESSSYETYNIIAHSILSVMLCFSLVNMVNKRLIWEIQWQDEKFYRAFNHAPYAIMLSNVKERNILMVNHSFSKITGYSKEEAAGKSTVDLKLWVQPEIRNELANELFKKGEIHHKEIQIKRKDESIFDGILHASLLHTDEESIVLSTIIDVSEERTLIKKLQKTSNELIESNRAKDKLFSIIAHDLKSPFGNVVALSQILKEQIEAGEYSDIAKHAHAIEISSKRASDLLQNLLEWSRLQIGTLAFNPSLIDPQILVDEVIDLVRVNLEKKELKVSVQNQVNIPLMLDKNIMSTILRNLLTNAIKFTHRGGHIWLHILNIEGGVSFTVQDNGVGIPNEKIPLLFDISEKTSSLGTEQEKGTGLGLPICKELLEKHGGTIEVKSILGKGSSFICKIYQTHPSFTEA
jgi:PAS domain S-box-containing protein